MQSILVPITDDEGFDCRANAALKVAKLFDGHLTFLHGTPISEYIAADPFGGAYYVQEHEEAVRDGIAARQARAEAFMQNANAPWRFVDASGAQEEVLVEHSRLADLIVVSDPPATSRDDADAASTTTYLVMTAQCPLMMLPENGRQFEPGSKALIAWNGSAPAGKALRAAVPLLKHASETRIVTFGPDPQPFTAEAAAVYLARHDISPEVVLHERTGDIAEAMHDYLIAEDAGLLVMGAYSHSRVREFVFGGVSRHFIRRSPVPLLMAH